MNPPSDGKLISFWTWRDLSHQRANEDAEYAAAFAERAKELRDELDFLLAGGLSEGAEQALEALAEQDMSDFCIMVDLAEERVPPGIVPLPTDRRDPLRQFLDHEPWHSLKVDTDLTVALAMYEDLAIREDNLPWYDVSPNLVRITARVLDQANAEQIKRFAGDLESLHQRTRLELPEEVALLVRNLVETAAHRVGIAPPPIA